jgi:predicted transposase/invertase (TIGR01784 family)
MRGVKRKGAIVTGLEKAGRMPIAPTNDLLFYKAMASAEHPEITAGFISDMLGIEVASVEVEQPYDIKRFVRADGELDLNRTEVDVLVKLGDGSYCVVEMQNLRLDFNLQRSIHYVASRYTANYGIAGKMVLGAGHGNAKYSSLVPVHGINVLGQSVFICDNDAKRTFCLYDVEHARGLCDGAFGYNPLQQLMTVSFLELGKLEGAHGNVAHWIDFFKGRDIGKDAPEYLQAAARLVEVINLDEEEYTMISIEERREQDRLARESWVYKEGLTEGRAEGRAEGIAEGRAEERAEAEAEIAQVKAELAQVKAELAQAEALLAQAAER